MSINISKLLKNILSNASEVLSQSASQAQSASAKIDEGVNEARDEGEDTGSCDDVVSFLHSDAMKGMQNEIIGNVLNTLNGNNTNTCFNDTLKQYKPDIIKTIDNLEIKNKNMKKNIYSNLVGLDIRIDYLKSLNDNIEKLNRENDSENNEDSSKALSYDEKNDINKRLAIFYNKNLDILNIIYKILYYIYLSLFVIYFILCVFNFYMYKYKQNNEYFKKFKFTFIGTLIIIFIPTLLNYIFNKYMFF